MKILTQQIIDRLNLVREAILEQPSRFYMGYWFDATNAIALEKPLIGSEPQCGTTLCLAGWMSLKLGAEVSKYENFLYERKEGHTAMSSTPIDIIFSALVEKFGESIEDFFDLLKQSFLCTIVTVVQKRV